MKRKLYQIRNQLIGKSTLLLMMLLLWSWGFAQSPEKMSYQAVIRNSSDAIVANTQIGMEINIRQGSPTGVIVYTETQTPTTNANGLVSIELGGTGLSAIDWSTGSYFIETKTDFTGGTNYAITGTSQLLSVPYALYAKKTESVPLGMQTGDMQYWDGTTWVTFAAGTEGQVLTFTGGVPTWKTEVGDHFVISFSTGKIWMDRNLGASRLAISIVDSVSFGDLYQWGRGSDGHQSRTSNITTVLSDSDTPGHGNFIISSSSPYDWRSPQNQTLWQGIYGINNPCPDGYRLPTETEWEAERASWGSNTIYGAFYSPLKLTLAGFRSNSSGAVIDGSYGYYWSRTLDGFRSRSLFLSTSHAQSGSNSRATGLSVRCIKD